MVYIGVAPQVDGQFGRQACRAWIDPSLPVAGKVRREVPNMPYWPGYADISPEHRAIYLKWLAGGRMRSDLDAGYMFLFFYGLERRFMVDTPPDDVKRVILSEVMRLKVLFGGSSLVRRYLSTFVGMAQVMLGEIPDDPLSIDASGAEVPLPLAVGLGARIGQGEALSADWLLAWFRSHPEASLRTPAKRAPQVFEATFRALFDKRFPEGLKVTKPRRKLRLTYEAASSEFTQEITPELGGAPVLDISSLRRPIEIAQEIADAAMEALDPYSRLLGRDEGAEGSLRAHLLLPLEIQGLFPCPEADELATWARERIAAGGLVPVGDVVEQVTGNRPAKPGKRDLTETSDMLARLGIGFAPDPRFALRKPRPGEPVVLFDLGAPSEVPGDASSAYAEAMLRIALGAFVAHADGRITEDERAALIAQAETADLPEAERRHLLADLRWFLTVPPDMTVLRRRLGSASEAEAGTLRAALVAAAHSDGAVSGDEVASLEKAYRALGLDTGLVYSDLHAGDAGEPVVRAARPGAPGEAIPGDTAGSAPLDAARIAAIRSETARVSDVLGAIFSDESDDADEPGEALSPVAPETSPLPGLNLAHARLVKTLLTQDHWEEEAFDALCRARGLMPSGALETINEWSFEIHDEALLDAYEGYDIEPGLAAALRPKLENTPCPT
ncbi:MAG: hypothetical protein CMJ75_14210 [Planctomycetaceae bacterium]|nr:hypothetical protein [Planctomycetaceae bacterium]